MTPELFTFEVVSLFVGLLVFLFYWMIVRPRVRVHVFRDDLFSLRTELFDRMLSANKPFNDPGHVAMRDVLNGTIRLAEWLQPVALCLWAWLTRDAHKKSTLPQDLTEDDEIRGIVQHCYDRYVWRVSRFLFLSHRTGNIVAVVLAVRALMFGRSGLRNVLTDNQPLRALRDGASSEGRIGRTGNRGRWRGSHGVPPGVLPA